MIFFSEQITLKYVTVYETDLTKCFVKKNDAQMNVVFFVEDIGIEPTTFRLPV